MALMFNRLAHNFIKNGYYPTDAVTLTRILGAIEPAGARIRIFDPCCGEGTALADVKQHLAQSATVQALGVEYDSERAWHAKRLLDTALHSDIHDVMFAPRSMGLLFLNPPYGDVVADKAQTGGESGGRARLEKLFYRRTWSSLKLGGLLVLIVPHYVLDAEFAQMIARNFEQVRFFMAPEKQFKQCVVFGVRRRSDRPNPAIAELLERGGRGEIVEALPEVWPHEPYGVPDCDLDDPTFRLTAVRLDAPQLQAEVDRLKPSTLWPSFATFFAQGYLAPRAPLCPMRPWHLALALAAGQVGGVVRSPDGRVLFVKGDTFKAKRDHVDVQTHDDGSITETRVSTDVFVPLIRGIDFTPGASLGSIVTVS